MEQNPQPEVRHHSWLLHESQRDNPLLFLLEAREQTYDAFSRNPELSEAQREQLQQDAVVLNRAIAERKRELGIDTLTQP